MIPKIYGLEGSGALSVAKTEGVEAGMMGCLGYIVERVKVE